MCGAWNPHSDSISIGLSKNIHEYDLRSNKKQVEISDAHELGVRCLDYNQSKPHVLVSGGDDCMIRIWDTRNTKTCLQELSDHSHWVWDICFNKFHDQLLLSSSSDCQVNLQSVVSVSSTPFQTSNSSPDDDVDRE